MANLELIAPQNVARFRYSLDPVRNLLCSLFLINEGKEEITEWITQTTRQLTSDQVDETKIITAIASRLVQGKVWSSFPEWLDQIRERTPEELQTWLIKDFLHAAASYQNISVEQLPSPEEILADEEAYLSTYERVYAEKGHDFDRAYHLKEYQLLRDPVLAKDRILVHLEWIWHEFLLPEWERILPMLNDSITAFETLDFSDMSTEDALCRITGRDHMPQIWEKWIASVEEIIIIPSAHIGPYLMTMDKTDNKVWLVVRAHIPEGATVSSPSLTRSELLMQLSALSNDTRLRILEYLKEKGELNAHDIQVQLGLTQSATSRHVLQLVATGYVHQRRLDGVKRYFINHQRVNQTCDALAQFLN
jgi:DNA-binding transcriptional ArsR family regulator